MSDGSNDEDISEMESGFWSKIPRTSAKDKRTDVEQAGMQLLQQWLAGVMNKYGLGSNVYGTLLDEGQAALCDPNSSKADLISLAGQIVILTEANDSGVLPSTIPLGADPRAAKDSAKLAETEWDMVLP